jgi:hypothetical protein
MTWTKYAKNICCQIGKNLWWCDKILYHVYMDGWTMNELCGWKMLFVEEVWIAQVYGQGFKGPNIHSKSIIP